MSLGRQWQHRVTYPGKACFSEAAKLRLTAELLALRLAGLALQPAELDLRFPGLGLHLAGLGLRLAELALTSTLLLDREAPNGPTT
jgi:hypothetical protein